MLLKFLSMVLAVLLISACNKVPITEQAILDSQDARKRYAQAIRARVLSHWSQPQHLSSDERCKVKVLQNRSGEVLKVEVLSSDDCSTEMSKSVEDAVFKASPLPIYDSRVFDRNIQFLFVPSY